MNDVTYINRGRRAPENERSLGSVIHEAIDEFKAFAQTRIAMLTSEMRENLGTLKAAAPTFAIGSVLVLTAWLVLTGALISVLWVAFVPSLYAPFFACLIVGVFYLLLGGIALMIARSALKDKPVVPKRTLQVLKEDRIWLQNEAKTQL